jgi:alpha-beta hydrolase superfamily lysophospholipase
MTADYVPDGDAVGQIVLVHGYGEHAGRYVHVIEALCGAGYSVHTLDHRGHGESEGTRAYFNTLWEPVADLRLFVNHVQSQTGNRTLIMLGHSMGALIALVFAIQYAYELKALILSGVALTADLRQPPMLIHVANLLNRFIPKAPLADGAPISELSNDPSVALAFTADPLTYKGKMRVRMGVSIQRAAAWARDNLEMVELPVLLMHGADDRICPPDGSRMIHERAASADKTFRLYDGMKHEIFNERERARVIADLTAWLNAHTLES